MLGHLLKVVSLVTGRAGFHSSSYSSLTPLLHPHKIFLFFVGEGTVRGYLCLTHVSKSAMRWPRCDFGPLRLLTEKPLHSRVESSRRV